MELKVGLRVALGSPVCFFGPFRVEVARVGVGVSENRGVPYFGVLVIKNPLFRVLHLGLLFSETPA